jgi:hypothetical protein
MNGELSLSLPTASASNQLPALFRAVPNGGRRFWEFYTDATRGSGWHSDGVRKVRPLAVSMAAGELALESLGHRSDGFGKSHTEVYGYARRCKTRPQCAA